LILSLPCHSNLLSHFEVKRGGGANDQAYVWLHKGAFGCAEDIVKGKKTTKYVQPIGDRVRGTDKRLERLMSDSWIMQCTESD
jgi:hypothetical protein